MPAPFKDPRTGIYYFRKTIPSELRQVFGKREYKISLGTRDPVEAKSMMAEPAAAYERLAANARQFLVGGVTAQAGLYVEQWLHDTQRDRLWLISAAKSLTAFNRLTSQSSFFGPAPDYVFEPETRLDADDALMVRTLYTRKRVPAQASLESVSRIDPEFLQWPVLQVIEHHRLIPDEALLRAIGLCIKRQLIEAIIGFLSDRKTAKAASPAPLIVIDNVQSTAPSRFDSADGPEVGLTVTQAFDAWKTYSKGRARKAQLVQEWDLAVRRFVALFGDIDMGRIRPQMVRDFREKLLELPGRTKKSIKALPLDEQASIAAREGLATLAPATVNKALSALRSITEHVIEKMSQVPLEINAAKLAKFVEAESGEEKRLPFEEEEMATIFRDFTISDSTGISDETLFWMVLLAPFTGCRLEEIGTLRPSNVRSEQGIWFIAIERDRAQLRADHSQEEKSLKSSNADRDIPIHSILLRAGFMNYVERRRSERAEWLFPDLRPNKFGKRTCRVSRLFARYLEECGITDDEKVFHSFRHSIRRNLRGRAKEEMVDLICGHADGKTGRRYGRGADMRPLREVIELIDYGGPDWNEVVVQGRRYAGLPPETKPASAPVQLGLV